ncbi:MAG: sugar phosphate isomerase/epimerase [Alteraurantiacibacter sp.]|nr:sugar phosphate isomerase/epimerase [Alteraurantiacibacter sp.]
MRLGINLLLWTGHVADSMRPVLEHIAATGFDGVEVPIFATGEPQHFRRLGFLLDDLGLARTASSAFTSPQQNPISAVAAERQAAFDQALALADCAAELKAELIAGPLFQPLGYFTGAGPTPAEQERCADFLCRLAPELRARDLVLAIEPLNRFEAYLINTAAQGMALVEQVADPAVGLLFDTFHAHIEEKDTVAALTRVSEAGHLVHVHISENDRGVPGSGQARIAEAIALLATSGYAGWLTIEAFGTAVPELAAATRVWRAFFADPAEVVEQGYIHMRQCLAWKGEAERDAR